MGGAPGLRAARCEPFGSGLSGTAREQPAIVGVGPARTVGGVLRGPRGTRTANRRGVRPLGSGTRLEPSSADRPHLGWVYVVVAVCPVSAETLPRQRTTVSGCYHEQRSPPVLSSRDHLQVISSEVLEVG